MGSRFSGVLVVLLALVVVGGTAWAYLDWRDRVDATVEEASDSLVVPSPRPSASPTAEPEPADEVVSLWIGDGYTAGVGADSPEDGYACQTAEELDWTCEVDAVEGTGFANAATGDALLDRLPQVQRGVEDPDIVVVDAGRNDLRIVSTINLRAAMDDYLSRLRAAYPEAVLVQVVPWTLTQDAPLPDDVAGSVRDLAEKYDGYVVDPYGAGWAGAGRTDRPALRSPGGGASQDGHDYVAERLIRALGDLDLPQPLAR
ncbi:SGNH/GDSL hydrolase family protein [Nocardioides sp. NPDC092400]|uniref:SGNH/GDSL hydrolase family protein n=1 Tax=Nocardioides sp. NPDC092400 TaxID=3155196 RepID=UPI003418918E